MENGTDTLLAQAEYALREADVERAEALCRAHLDAHPDEPAALAVLGEIELGLGRFAAAVTHLEAALGASDEDETALYALAGAYTGLGHFAAAAERFHAYLSRNPTEADAWSHLAMTLAELGRLDEALVAAERALELAPTSPAARLNKAVVLQKMGEHQQALALFRAGLEDDPDDAIAHGNLALALEEQGDFAGALPHQRRALELEPGSPERAYHLGRTLLALDRADEAQALVEEALALEPGQSGLLALQTLVWLARGHTQEAGHAQGLDNLVHVETLPAPAGFGDLASFHRALAAHVLAHPSLMQSPPGYATVGGQHSGSLLAEPRGPVVALQAQLEAAVRAYIDVHSGVDHPFLAVRPAAFSIDLWAVVLPAGGLQRPHIHPGAWLSGVYYLSVPESMTAAADAVGETPPGWLELGRPDRPSPLRADPVVRAIEPRPGRLVLFPAFVYHRTQPFAGEGLRVSIAFDVVPV